jgi:hypothetical protein
MQSHCQPGAIVVRRTSTLLSLSAITAAGLTLLAPGAVRADTTPPVYHSEPLVTSGDRYGTSTIPARDDLYVGGLTDTGQIIFSAGNANGGGPDLLLQWADNMLTPIVTPSSDPVGASPGPVYSLRNVTLDRPVSVNRFGSALFSVSDSNGTSPWGTFRWDAATQRVIPVALKGMPATGNLVFTRPGGYAPAINDHNQMALVGQVKNPAGPGGFGLFTLGQDQVLRPVLLPRQELPGAAHGQAVAATDAFMAPSIDDTGKIAFLTRAEGSPGHSAYLWEFDGIIPIAIAGTGIPGAGRFTDVGSVSLDNGDQGALITATTNKSDSSHWGLYHVAGGKIQTVVAPGWTMPGGGIFKTVQYVLAEENSVTITAVSSANAANQHAFLATLEDGSAGAYSVDSAGQLSLLFKATAQPKPAQITEVGYSITFVPGSRPCLNNRGQVALSVRLKGGRSMILLLTPAQP